MLRIKFTSFFYKTMVVGSTFLLVSCQNEKPRITMQQTREAPKSFEQVLVENGDSEQKQKILEGMQSLRQRDFDSASRTFNEILTYDPTNSGVHTLNALTYQLMAKNGDFNAYNLAEAGYQQARKFNPENTFAALQLGRVKAEKQDYIGAQEEFAQVLLSDPSNMEAFYELASVSYLLSDLKTARMCVDRLLEHNPTKPEYVRAGALVYAVQGNKEKANKLLSTYQALEKQPKKKAYLERRVNDWFNLHESGKITLASATVPSGSSITPTQATLLAAPPPAILIEGATQAESTTGASDIASEAPHKHDTTFTKMKAQEGMVVVDAVALRIFEQGQTSKGNNVLQNFTLTVAPFTKYFAKDAGGPITDASLFPLNNISTLPTATGTLLPGKIDSMLPVNNKVSLITSAISFGSLNYALNIANVSRRSIEIIGRPTLTSYLGKPAEFFSGENTKIALQGTYGGSVTDTPTGSTLKVTPLAIENGYVTLDVEIVDSFLQETEDQIASRAATLTPLVFSINNSFAKGTLKVKLGETVMLAGFIERTEASDNSGFPFLKDIPIIQYFFSQEVTSSTHVSVMYLITPRSYDNFHKSVNAFARDEEAGRRPRLQELESRHKNWLGPEMNIVPILRSLGPLYQDFRLGDFMPLRWASTPHHYDEELTAISEFLWYLP